MATTAPSIPEIKTIEQADSFLEEHGVSVNGLRLTCWNRVGDKIRYHYVCKPCDGAGKVQSGGTCGRCRGSGGRGSNVASVLRVAQWMRAAMIRS